MRIRSMEKRDVQQVALLEMENPSPWSVSLLYGELKKAGAIVLVGEEAGRVVAWCSAFLIPPEAELLKIAVARKWRQRGCAEQLFAVLCSLLNERGCTSLFLEVRSGNMPALNFYGKNGFVQIGRRDLYYSNPDDDALVLKKNHL